MAESLKAVIPRRSALVAKAQIATVHITLPYLYARTGDRFASCIEHSAGKHNDFATGLLDLACNLDQITVDVIEAHPCQRIEWSLGS